MLLKSAEVTHSVERTLAELVRRAYSEDPDIGAVARALVHDQRETFLRLSDVDATERFVREMDEVGEDGDTPPVLRAIASTWAIVGRRRLGEIRDAEHVRVVEEDRPGLPSGVPQKPPLPRELTQELARLARAGSRSRSREQLVELLRGFELRCGWKKWDPEPGRKLIAQLQADLGPRPSPGQSPAQPQGAPRDLRPARDHAERPPAPTSAPSCPRFQREMETLERKGRGQSSSKMLDTTLRDFEKRCAWNRWDPEPGRKVIARLQADLALSASSQPREERPPSAPPPTLVRPSNSPPGSEGVRLRDTESPRTSASPAPPRRPPAQPAPPRAAPHSSGRSGAKAPPKARAAPTRLESTPSVELDLAAKDRAALELVGRWPPPPSNPLRGPYDDWPETWTATGIDLASFRGALGVSQKVLAGEFGVDVAAVRAAEERPRQRLRPALQLALHNAHQERQARRFAAAGLISGGPPLEPTPGTHEPGAPEVSAPASPPALNPTPVEERAAGVHQQEHVTAPPPAATVSAPPLPTSPGPRGHELYAVRLRLGLTQRAFAERLGVAPSTVAKAEVAAAAPLNDTLRAALTRVELAGRPD